MRSHEIKEYTSVLQVLTEPGCPICTFLKNVQTKLVQEGGLSEFVQLCNAHTWAVAAVRQSETAAQIFLSLLKHRHIYRAHECSICLLLDQEEVLRIREFIAILDRRPVLDWIKQHGTFCLPHGLNLRAEASIPTRALIDEVLDRRASELQNSLRGLSADASHGNGQHGGLLGRAAEYLVSQRGLSLGHNAHNPEHVKH
jgi:hypothetical protein